MPEPEAAQSKVLGEMVLVDATVTSTAAAQGQFHIGGAGEVLPLLLCIAGRAEARAGFYGVTDKKYTLELMSGCNGGLTKFQCMTMTGVPAGAAEHNGEKHGKRGFPRPRAGENGSIVSAEYTQQVQQVNEQVVDIQVQCHGGADVIGLAAVNDTAGIKQNQA